MDDFSSDELALFAYLPPSLFSLFPFLLPSLTASLHPCLLHPLVLPSLYPSATSVLLSPAFSPPSISFSSSLPPALPPFLPHFSLSPCRPIPLMYPSSASISALFPSLHLSPSPLHIPVSLPTSIVTYTLFSYLFCKPCCPSLLFRCQFAQITTSIQF